MLEIVTLEGEDLRYIVLVLTQALADENPVRVACDGGFKLSVAQRMWTPPLGRKTVLT